MEGQHCSWPWFEPLTIVMISPSLSCHQDKHCRRPSARSDAKSWHYSELQVESKTVPVTARVARRGERTASSALALIRAFALLTTPDIGLWHAERDASRLPSGEKVESEELHTNVLAAHKKGR